MNHPTKAISILQPWASLIIFGPKRIENRTWPSSYRGPLFIHAGKSTRLMPAPGTPAPGGRDPRFDQLPPGAPITFGAIIGVVDMVDCLPLDQVADDPFADGPWCHIYQNPRPITPIPCKGNLNLWTPPGSIAPETLLTI